MENQENIHYRTGGRLSHCGVECLPGGKDIGRIIIARIEYKESEMINGRTEQGVWVAHFAPNPYTDLPFILNVTNRKRITKLFPECDGYLARLKNIPVRLTKERTRDVQDGGETWGLRISKMPADPEPVKKKKTITADKVEAVVKWAIKNKKSLADIAESYEMSEDIKQQIEAGLTQMTNDMPE